MGNAANVRPVPIDPTVSGRSYPATASYLVSREKIREFADAIGESATACRDEAAARALGHPDVVAPPTFATVLTLRVVESVLADPELGLDWSRVVHGEEKYAYTAPICAGDELVVVPTIEAVRAVGGNAMVTLRADVTTSKGEERVTARSMLVVRGDA
jgi:acyl dehydratase